MSKQSCSCGEAHGACATEYQYAVKLVCGQLVSQENAPTPLAPGQYWTATNIHNPSKCDDVQFRWKVAVASPGRPGPVLPYSRIIVLKPDEAIELDCQQVAKAFGHGAPKFVKGFLVLNSSHKMDVVAVYTASAGPCSSSAFHTERVEGSCVPQCEDLALSLNTGSAAWQTVSPSQGPAVVVNPVSPGWSSPPFGALWISEKKTDGGPAKNYSRSYQLCFHLCSGFTVPPPFKIQGLSDGPGTVFLNGNSLGTLAGWQNPTTLTVNPNFLRAGENCFRVDVVNGGEVDNPTGFALAGNLFVAKGKCPCSRLPIAPPATPTGLGADGVATELTEG